MKAENVKVGMRVHYNQGRGSKLEAKVVAARVGGKFLIKDVNTGRGVVRRAALISAA